MSSFSSFTATFLLLHTAAIVRSFFLLLTLKSDRDRAILLLHLAHVDPWIWSGRKKRQLQAHNEIFFLLVLSMDAFTRYIRYIRRFACQKAIQVNGRNRLVREKLLQ